MTSIKFKVIGLIQAEFELAGSVFEPMRFGFPDLTVREMDALLISVKQYESEEKGR